MLETSVTYGKKTNVWVLEHIKRGWTQELKAIHVYLVSRYVGHVVKEDRDFQVAIFPFTHE